MSFSFCYDKSVSLIYQLLITCWLVASESTTWKWKVTGSFDKLLVRIIFLTQ